jgi:hypothetical protein
LFSNGSHFFTGGFTITAEPAPAPEPCAGGFFGGGFFGGGFFGGGGFGVAT